jgi:hypothetical protein
VETKFFNIPILTLHNESETETIDVLIEPHLELYELPPKKACVVYYFQTPDNNVPEKTLEVAYRDDCIVIYPPGGFSPVLRIDGVPMKNRWA